MSNKAITWAYAQKTGTPGRKLVLLKLADQANDEGYCWPSKGSIARDCEMTGKGVQRILHDLEGAKLIRIESRRGWTNKYWLSLPAEGAKDAPRQDRGEPTMPPGESSVPGEGEPSVPEGGAYDAPNPQYPKGEPSKEPSADFFSHRFLSAYPVSGNKVKTEQEIQRLNPGSELQATIMQAVEAIKERRAEIRRRGGWHPAWPNPENFIKDRRWEDDLDPLPESGEGGWAEWVQRGQSVGLDWSKVARKYNAEFGGGSKKFIKDVIEAEEMEALCAGAE